MDTDAARARLEAARTRLEEKRRAAQDLVSGTPEEAVQELATYDQHLADQGTETFERERDLSVLQRVEAQLREVDDALARLDAGTYGRCEICGKEIGEARLEAMPAARYCLEDQARAEREGRFNTGLPSGGITY